MILKKRNTELVILQCHDKCKIYDIAQITIYRMFHDFRA